MVLHYGLVAQLGAHHIRIVGVEGSNPFKSTNRKATLYGWLSYWYKGRFEDINVIKVFIFLCIRLSIPEPFLPGTPGNHLQAKAL